MGGSGSDECTAGKAQVLAGYKAITKDSDDEPAEGTIIDRGTSQTGGFGEGTDYYAINGLPVGYYRSDGSSWAPEARCPKTTVRKYLGVNAAIIRSGYTIAGVAGTLAAQSAINFKAAAISHDKIRISWTNPSKGPWTGVFIQIKTGGYPGTGGGTRIYLGQGENETKAGASNYCIIPNLSYETQYYFTCTSYTKYSDGTNEFDEWGTSYNVTAMTPEWWDTSSTESMSIWVNSTHFPKVLNDIDGKFKAMAWSDAGTKAIAGSAYALNLVGKSARACMYMNASAFVPKYYDTIVGSLANTGYFDKKSTFAEKDTYEQSSTGRYRSYVIYSGYPQGRESNSDTTWESSLGDDVGSIVVINKYKYGYNAYTDPNRGYSGCDVSYYGNETYGGQKFNMVFRKGRYFQGETGTTDYTKYVNAGLKDTWDARFEWKYWGDGKETFTKNIVCFGPALLGNSCADEKSMIAYAYWWGNLYRCK